jgi:hypothetical protein
VIPEATVKEWECMCKAWDAAPYPKAKVVESPFFAKSRGQLLVVTSPPPLTLSSDLSEAQIRRELEEEEDRNVIDKNSLLHTPTKTEFIALGLGLEDEQYIFSTCWLIRSNCSFNRQKLWVLVKEKSTKLDSEISEKRAALREQIQNWKDIRGVLQTDQDRAWPQGQNMPCAPTDHPLPNLIEGRSMKLPEGAEYTARGVKA